MNSRFPRLWSWTGVALVGGAIALGVALWRWREPQVGGRTATEWVVAASAGVVTWPEAQQALAEMNPRRVAVALERAARAENTAWQRAYFRLYPKLPGAVQDRLHRPLLGAHVRQAAAVGLGFLGTNGLAGLLEAARHRDPDTRAESLTALARLGEAAGPALTIVLAATDDPNVNVRLTALRALGDIAPRDPSARRRLAEAIEHSNGAVQLVAGEALHKAGEPLDRTIRVLSRVLEKDDLGPAGAAILRLEEFAATNAAARAALETATTGSHWLTRTYASNALQRLAAKTAAAR